MSSDNHHTVEISDRAALVKNPLLSVVMITYNHGQFLSDAIEGAMRQRTEHPYELVIGEDCSTDKTRDMAMEFQRRYPDKIRVLYSETNCGMWTNMLRTVNSCRGKYLAFCEGDDYWHNPLKLAKQVRFLEEHPTFGLVHSDYHRRLGERIQSCVRATEQVRIPQGWVVEDLLWNNFITTCTVCCRSDLVRGFFNSPLACREYFMGDYPMWLFLCRLAQAGYINESFATYRYVAGSATNQGVSSRIRHRKSGQQVRADYIRYYSCSAKGRENVEIHRHSANFRNAYMVGDRTACSQEFSWLRENYPEWNRSWKMRVTGFSLSFEPAFKLLRRISMLKKQIES